MVNYVSAKLEGRPAEFAGDDLQDQDRVFGLLSLAQNDADEDERRALVDALADEGIDIAETGMFPLDPGRAQELATGIIAKMKEAGVTTVVVRADPITLPAFTREATKQNWFPEWVLAGYQFTDSSTFARTFDQDQWAHAFGVSFLPPKRRRRVTPAYRLYEWFHGEPPPADKSLLLTYPQVALFFTGVHLAGPDLTTEHFRDGIFAFPPTPRARTQPSVDYGSGIWDESRRLRRHRRHGRDLVGRRGHRRGRDRRRGHRPLPLRRRRRALPAERLHRRVEVFDRSNSVTEIDDPPPAEIPPDYPSPAG